MRIPSGVRTISSASAVLAILAGCASYETGSAPLRDGALQAARGGASVEAVANSVVPLNAPPRMQREMGSTRMPVHGFMSPQSGVPGGASGFVADYRNNAVYIYNAAGQLTGTLTGFGSPDGVAVDKGAALYVADENNFRVQVYAAGYRGQPTTLMDVGQYPVDVSVDGNGNVAVANIVSTSHGPGSVSFYAPGATSPTNTVYGSNFASVYFDGFDARGNLYVDGLDSNGKTLVGEIIGGINGTAITTLTTNNTIAFPGGVKVSGEGAIAIDDQGSLAIDSYRPPKNGSLGSPVAVTPLTGASDPAAFAFVPGNRLMLVADAALGTASLFAYPKGGTPVKTLELPQGAEPFGTAVYPPAVP